MAAATTAVAVAEASEGDKYRIYIYGEGEKNTKWRYGAPPNYDLVNKLFEEGRTKVWPAGSLEEKVQNLVKTWEMEMFHKTCWDDYKTLDPSNYTLSLNGRKGITLEEKRLLGGGYNSLLQTSLPEKYRCYNPAIETADSSHKAFTTAFPRGFALEVLHVYSGPPVIVYKFRHWGFMEGPFQGHPPTGEKIEFYGMAVFQVDEMMKVVKVEFFYDRGELLGALLKGANSESSGTLSCPFLNTAS
ncbi:pathogen-related protein-like [Magnolia sinica]|uniref:pathogen-related protein-like n=1 Tax=Magnolia sinica TaxID=86752 RepID=UPI00265AD216|nr:pathogen-related protein-like [Magnolia sinica]